MINDQHGQQSPSSNNNITTDTQSASVPIPSSQVINLIQHHLIESGLTESAKAIQAETKIGSLGLLKHAHTQFIKNVKRGEWGLVLDTLSTLTLRGEGGGGEDGEDDDDGRRSNGSSETKEVMGQIHEMAILELGDLGEMDLAFATLKMCRNMLDMVNGDDDNRKTNGGEGMTMMMNTNLGQSVERRLHAINALRTSIHSTNGASGINENETLLPPDYYGPNDISKEKRRNDLAKRIGDVVPIIPPSRLISVLQQSIKWQVHTGKMPMIKDKWSLGDDNDDDSNDDADTGKQEKDGAGKDNKRKKKSKNRGRRKRKFDLVLGEVDVEEKRQDRHSKSTSKSVKNLYEKIPRDPYSEIKFSKKTVVTSATFYTDIANQKVALITGSSDGFIEVWDEDSKFKELRMDLDYQKKDELMCHYGDEEEGTNSGSFLLPSILALTVNSDGTMLASGDNCGSINIWNLKKGSCLRSFEKVHGGAVTCLDFSKDTEESSRILSCSQDGTAREFGLRTSRMLKEFQGHKSFVNCCNYVLADKLLIVTASADGTIRVWDGKSAELLRSLNPSSSSGPSAIVSLSQDSATTSDINVHTVLHLHTPRNSMIVIPREPKAYLVTYSGVILRTFTNDVSLTKNNDKKSSSVREDFVKGVVSPSNKWFYAVTEGGMCICFDLASGKVEKMIRDFGIESTGGKVNHELTGVVHHPHKGLLGAFSSSSNLKRGLLMIWK